MKFNLQLPENCIKAKEYLWHLIGKEARIEITEKRKQRSLIQNSYLYLILGWTALEFGNTEEEMKQDFKKLNHEIFRYEKNGNEYFKSTSELDTREMTVSISKFRHFHAQNGFYIPEPNEQDYLDYIENEINKHQEWI